MHDLKAAVKNNALPITVALAGGLYAAVQLGAIWFFAAVPAFIFIMGMERLYSALPPTIKPFAGLISLAAFFVLSLLLVNFLAAINNPQTAPLQPAGISTPAPARTAPIPEVALSTDPDTANRVYGLFLSELSKRTNATANFDQVTWMQSMSECIRNTPQQGTLTPEQMEQIAGCADKRMAERLQKVE